MSTNLRPISRAQVWLWSVTCVGSFVATGFVAKPWNLIAFVLGLSITTVIGWRAPSLIMRTARAVELQRWARYLEESEVRIDLGPGGTLRLHELDEQHYIGEKIILWRHMVRAIEHVGTMVREVFGFSIIVVLLGLALVTAPEAQANNWGPWELLQALETKALLFWTTPILEAMGAVVAFRYYFALIEQVGWYQQASKYAERQIKSASSPEEVMANTISNSNSVGNT